MTTTGDTRTDNAVFQLVANEFSKALAEGIKNALEKLQNPESFDQMLQQHVREQGLQDVPEFSDCLLRLLECVQGLRCGHRLAERLGRASPLCHDREGAQGCGQHPGRRSGEVGHRYWLRAYSGRIPHLDDLPDATRGRRRLVTKSPATRPSVSTATANSRTATSHLIPLRYPWPLRKPDDEGRAKRPGQRGRRRRNGRSAALLQVELTLRPIDWGFASRATDAKSAAPL